MGVLDQLLGGEYLSLFIELLVSGAVFTKASNWITTEVVTTNLRGDND